MVVFGLWPVMFLRKWAYIKLHFDFKKQWNRLELQEITPVGVFPYRTYTYILLIPWRRVLLEKLTGFQLVKKFPVFYGAQRMFTLLALVLDLAL
jgi:hypothetical protein